MRNWYQEIGNVLQTSGYQGDTADVSSIDDWAFFSNRLRYERRLVLYAQRQYLSEWFPEFDPTDPDAVDEINRPWDMDHIHPRYYIEGRHKIPQIIRDWHGSIGNLRAWPLDANRADAESAPAKKLGDVNSTDQAYGMLSAEQKRLASFISEVQWNDWKASTPEDHIPPNYLAQPSEYGNCRIFLVNSITSRTCALYREWYEKLRLLFLMPEHEQRRLD